MEFFVVAISFGVLYVLFKVWHAMWIDRDIVIQDFKDRYKSKQELQAKKSVDEKKPKL